MKKIIYTLLLLLVVCQVADAKKIKNQSRNSGNKSQLAAKEQWPNFIDNFFDWLVSPWRPVWGEFKIDGQFPLVGRHGLEKGVRGMFYKPNNYLTILKLNK